MQLQLDNKKDGGDRSIEISKEQNLSSKNISKTMYLIDEAKEIFKKNDSDNKRVLKCPSRWLRISIASSKFIMR